MQGGKEGSRVAGGRGARAQRRREGTLRHTHGEGDTHVHTRLVGTTAVVVNSASRQRAAGSAAANVDAGGGTAGGVRQWGTTTGTEGWGRRGTSKGGQQRARWGARDGHRVPHTVWGHMIMVVTRTAHGYDEPAPPAAPPAAAAAGAPSLPPRASRASVLRRAISRYRRSR